MYDNLNTNNKFVFFRFIILILTAMNSNKVVEILQNIEITDQAIVGKSISILSRFAKEKLPVSTGFVITTLAFNMFLDYTDLRKYFENSRKTEISDHKSLRNAFNSVECPAMLIADVSKAYAKISGFTDAYVNLRALILDKKGQEVNHRSFVIFDIRGEDNVILNLRDLYRDVIFDNSKIIEKFFEGELQIVILAQKAQQSEASGVMFTTDVITKDSNKLIIEAVYGLESIVDHEAIIPDQYIFEKSKGTVSEKHISTQEYMAVRQVGGGASSVQKVKISPAWQKRQKLDDKHILTLAKTGQIVEEGMNEPQQVIWSYEAGKIWINFIESSDKLSLSKKHEPTLQDLIDEQIYASDTIPSENGPFPHNEGTDLNVHIPEDVRAAKNILVDLVLSDEEIPLEIEKPIINQEIEAPLKSEMVKPEEVTPQTPIHVIEQTPTVTHLKVDTIDHNIQKKHINKNMNKEPLLEGKYFAGEQAEGEVCFDPGNCKSNSILVLTGDEDLSASIKVAGFIIEDESDLLATRLNEYFNVPAVTGVPLAKKILKQGELIQIDGKSGNIYETVPFAQQVGEIEMNFVTRSGDKSVNSSFTFPVEKDETMVIRTEIPAENPEEVFQTKNVEELPLEVNISYEDSSEKKTEPEFKATVAVETAVVTPTITIKPHNNYETNKADLTTLLNLVDDETEIVDIHLNEGQDVSEEVKGVSPQDQFNVWGKSLENIISASKSVPSTVAADAIQQVIDDKIQIDQYSKEITFDTDEHFIASRIQENQPSKELESPFYPTATKVYINLIDEKLPSRFKNFDGIVFSSSFDQDIYLELLEDTLTKVENKEVFAVCPPYEKDALIKFLEQIYDLRNQGYRNLSLVLPDYRNKKEIAEVKKILSIIGLRRSSTFGIFANLSRTINVFRVAELDKSTVDGTYIDLFRLKMNMLGVEKLTASTRYVEGMKNMVEYVHENLKIDGRSILNITGFGNPEKVLEHIFKFGFWGVGCSLVDADNVKKHISSIERKRITTPASNGNSKLKRRA